MTVHGATGLGVVAILLWSMGVGLTRSLSVALGPYYGSAAIYTVSALFALLFLGKPKLAGVRPAYLFGCGFLFASNMICFSLAIGFAQSHQQSLELGLINYLWPSLTLILAVFLLGVRARGWLWLGMLCSLAGIIWSVSRGDIASLSFLRHIMQNPIAYGFAFYAAISWALYSNFVRIFSSGRSALVLFLMATATACWVIAWRYSSHQVTFSVSVGAQLLVIGLASSLGYVCWDKAMKQGNVTLVAIFSYFTPLSSLLIASIWLGTPLDNSFLTGIGLVITGSLLCWTACRR